MSSESGAASVIGSNASDSGFVTDIVYISSDGVGLSKLTGKKASPSTVMSYCSLPTAFGSVVDRTVAFQFRKRPRISSDVSLSEYSEEAQTYVKLLKTANSDLVDKILVMVGMKCLYCVNARGSKHIPGSISLLVVSDDNPDTVMDFKRAMQKRLEHILNGCPYAKKEMDSTSVEVMHGAQFKQDDTAIDSFAKSWIDDVVNSYFKSDVQIVDDRSLEQAVGYQQQLSHQPMNGPPREDSASTNQRMVEQQPARTTNGRAEALNEQAIESRQDKSHRPKPTPQPADSASINQGMGIDVQQLPAGLTNGRAESVKEQDREHRQQHAHDPKLVSPPQDSESSNQRKALDVHQATAGLLNASVNKQVIEYGQQQWHHPKLCPPPEDVSYNNQRMVVDVQQLPTGITSTRGGALGPATESIFRVLPEPLQLLLSKTSLCKFYRRPANQPSDTGMYSEEACKYLNSLDRLQPAMKRSALSLVCLFCSCCGDQFKYVGLQYGIDTAAVVFVECIRQLVIHTNRCPASKKFLGDRASSLLNLNLSGKLRKTIETFARLYLTDVQRAYFSNSTAASSTPNQHSPKHAVGCATKEAMISWQQEQRLRELQEGNMRNIKSVQQKRKREKKQDKKQRHSLPSVYPPPATKATTKAPKSSKTPSPKSRSFKASVESNTLVPLKPAILPEEYSNLFEVGLDELEWAMLSLCDGDVDDIFGQPDSPDCNMLSRMHDLVQLPSPRSDADYWVPLQLEQLAKLPYLIGSPVHRDALSQKSSKRQRQGEKETLSSLSRASANVFGRTFKQHDVVIPAHGCPEHVAKLMRNLIGNRRFMQAITDIRHSYPKLPSDRDRAKLARQIIERVQGSNKGSFFKSTVRGGDGSPEVFCCDDDCTSGHPRGSARRDFLNYVMFRLDHGFQDVLHPYDVGRVCTVSSSPQLSSSGKRNSVNFDEKPARTENGNKVVEVEYAPTLGLLRGGVEWCCNPSGERVVKFGGFLEETKSEGISENRDKVASLIVDVDDDRIQPSPMDIESVACSDTGTDNALSGCAAGDSFNITGTSTWSEIDREKKNGNYVPLNVGHAVSSGS